MERPLRMLCLTLVALIARPAWSQDKRPVQIDSRVVVLYEEVVTEQWPAMRDFVHVPVEAKRIEPGQCVRFAASAAHNGGEELLQNATYSFEVTVGSTKQSFPAAPPDRVKETTIIDADTLLAVASGRLDLRTFTQRTFMAASKAGWCAPPDTGDTVLTVSGKVRTANNKTVDLKENTLYVQTLATARTHLTFGDDQSVENWTQHYHFAPDPAGLIVALRRELRIPEAWRRPNVMAFYAMALKANKPAADEMMKLLPNEDPQLQLFAAVALTWAGYSPDAVVANFDERAKLSYSSFRKPDPFDKTPDRGLGVRQDILWGMFFATGKIEPVRAIASELVWGEDYDRYQAENNKHFDEVAARAAAYGAAGWSMAALSRYDNLLADYMTALECSPDIPLTVQRELANVDTNPAFTYPGSGPPGKRELKDAPSCH